MKREKEEKVELFVSKESYKLTKEKIFVAAEMGRENVKCLRSILKEEEEFCFFFSYVFVSVRGSRQ